MSGSEQYEQEDEFVECEDCPTIDVPDCDENDDRIAEAETTMQENGITVDQVKEAKAKQTVTETSFVYCRPDRKNLIEGLNLYPTAIQDKTIAVQNISNEYNEGMLAIKAYEVTMRRAVEAEVDDNGKAKFSNADKRQAETDSRLAKDDNYQTQLKQSESLKNSLDMARIELEFLHNSFSAARAITRLIGSD